MQASIGQETPAAYQERREQLYGTLRSADVFTWDMMDGEEYAVADCYVMREDLRQELAYATKQLARIYGRISQVVLQGEDGLLAELGLPPAAWSAVRVGMPGNFATIIGRFDFAETAHGLKMLEFNSDTPTGIVEAFAVNGHICRAFGLRDPNEGMAGQLASAFQTAIAEYARRGLRTDEVVFSALGWHEEDAGTTRYLMRQSGLPASFVPLGELRVYKDRLCHVLPDGRHCPIDVLYRLHALEKLSEERDEQDGYPTGAHVLDLMARGRLATINPPSALVPQTKAMQALIWRLYEQQQFFSRDEQQAIGTYMLPTYLDNLFVGKAPYVSKPIFGREGGAVKLYTKDGTVLEQDQEDSYWEQPMVYQQQVELPRVHIRTMQGEQAGHLLWGSFCIAGEPSAIIARVGSRITGNLAYYLPVGMSQ